MRRLLILLCVGALGMFALAVRGAAAADPLEARVTISFSSAPAADVIERLAAAAGMKAEIAAGSMRPVTITLTNVKLVTALNAVCDNALCTWRLAGSLRVTRTS